MKNKCIIILIVVVIIMTFSGCGGSKNVQPPAEPPAQEEPLSDGQLLVESRCASCHNLQQVYRSRAKDAWPGIVDRMIGKSPGLLNNDERNQVMDFLQENYGN
jgi:cytochrome c2